MKFKLQFGLVALFVTATLFAFVANWHGRKLDRQRDIARAVDMIGGLSSFDHYDILNEQNPNPQKIVELLDHLQALGDDASGEVIQNVCERFPVESSKHSRTTILDSLVQTFWLSGDALTPRPRWYFSGSRSQGVKFIGTGDGQYTLVDEPWPFPSSITVAEGIPFDNMFDAGILGHYHVSRAYLGEWIGQEATLTKEKLDPPDNPIASLEQATALLLANYSNKNKSNAHEMEWIEYRIKGYLCDQVYEMVKPAIPDFERPPFKHWLDSSGGFDIVKFEELSKLMTVIYWDDRSRIYRSRE